MTRSFEIKNDTLFLYGERQYFNHSKPQKCERIMGRVKDMPHCMLRLIGFLWKVCGV